MHLEEVGLEVFNGFNSSMLNGLANQNLKDWFNLLLKIEEVIVSVEDLSGFFMSLLVWNISSIRCPINEEIWFNFLFMNHILVIAKIFPLIG